MEIRDDFIDYLIYLREYNFRAPKRYLRDVDNPLELYDNEQFFNRYRFSKRVFTSEIAPLLWNSMKNIDNRGNPLPPILKMLAVLRFYATGNYQIDSGESHSMSQPTFCQLVKKVSIFLSQQIPTYIKFPRGAELRSVKRKFHSISGFPAVVVGCIDCTHIPIQSPQRERGENFRNRKGFFSINVQIVCGPNGEIFDIVARWPGSTHDSRIFDNSSVKLRFDRQEIEGLLLGDSGYAQSKYMFTPVLNPESPVEQRYNNSHITTRCTVERLFGVWKRRFSCLRRKLANNIVTTTHIITACAVLNNIAVKCRERLPIDVNINPVPDDPIPEPYVYAGENVRGNIIKRAFIAQYFNEH